MTRRRSSGGLRLWLAAQATLGAFAVVALLLIDELITSGKIQTNGNWKNGKGEALKPGANEDIYIPKAKSVECTAATTARSMYLEGNAKISGGSSLTLGNGEVPEGPAGVGWILKVDAEAVPTIWGSTITFASSATGTQKFAIGPSAGTVVALILKAKSTPKYLLEAALTITGTSINQESETWLDTNNFAVTAPGYFSSSATKCTLRLGKTTLTVTGALGFTAPAESTVEASEATIVAAGGGAIIAGGGYTYGTLRITAVNVSITGSSTWGKIEALNKGAAGGAGVRLTGTLKQKLTGATPLTSNGAVGELARIESTTGVAELEATGTGSGAAHEVRTDGSYEPANSFIAAKGIKWTRGTLYLPNGKDEGGNEKVTFGAEPGGSSFTREASDSLAIAESVARTLAMTRTATDAVALSESPARLAAASRSATDALSIAEAFAGGAAHPRSSSQALSIAEVAARTASATRAASDTASIAESPASAQAHPRGTTDTLSVAETPSRAAQGQTRTASDAVALTETPSSAETHPRAASETLGIAEAAARAAQSLVRTASEPLGLEETPGRTETHTRAATETLSISESAFAQKGESKAASDSVSIAEAAARTLSQGRGATDTTSIAEVATVSASHTGHASDSVTVGETPQAGRGAARSASDTLGIAEAPARGRSHPRSASETLAIAESPHVTIGSHTIFATDTLTITETVEEHLPAPMIYAAVFEVEQMRAVVTGPPQMYVTIEAR